MSSLFLIFFLVPKSGLIWGLAGALRRVLLGIMKIWTAQQPSLQSNLGCSRRPARRRTESVRCSNRPVAGPRTMTAVTMTAHSAVATILIVPAADTASRLWNGLCRSFGGWIYHDDVLDILCEALFYSRWVEGL